MATTAGVDDARLAKVRAALTEAGQAHVLAFLDGKQATPTEATALLEQLEALDLPALNQTFAGLGINDKKEEQPAAIAEYAPISDVAAVGTTPAAQLAEWEHAGLQAIAQGKVAALVLSGGQGTRLGFDGPKGMYDIGLPSHKPIFQLLAERVLRVSALAGAPTHLPFYVMTSPLNHAATQAFFATHGYFGLDPAHVVFFPQGTMPCFTLDGKLMLDGPGSLAQAPDGNGGIYPSLARTGTLADMRARGVEAFHVFSVDNVLVKVADPVYIGYCRSVGADCGNKVVWKASAHEKVGVVVNKNGRPAVVEYSEMEDGMKTLQEEGGKLVFGAGNICSHYFTVDFVEHCVVPRFGSVYHAAKKKIPCVVYPDKEMVKPSVENGVKLEAFIFDVFPFSARMALLEVGREEEFAPVKDAPGGNGDTPDKARLMLSEEAKRWVVAAGGRLVGGGEEEGLSEISPLVSYKGEGLEERVKGKDVPLPIRFV